MDKIQGFITVPTADLIDLVSLCGKIAGVSANFLKNYRIDIPEKKAEPQPVKKPPAKYEPTFEDGFLQGLGIKENK